MVLDVPGLQHAASLGVVVGVNHHAWPSIDPLDVLTTLAQQEQKTLGLHFLSPVVFSKVMVEGPTRSANVGTGV